MEEKLRLILFSDGTMTELYKAGFIGTKPFLYRDIYLFVDRQVKAKGISKTKAVLEASVYFDRSQVTVWAALKSFE